MTRNAYTEQEMDYIKQHYQTQTDAEIGKALGRSHLSIKNRRKLSKLHRKRPGEWPQEQLQYLAEHYPSTATKELAKTLGRTINQVNNKAAHMGIKKTEKYIQDCLKKCVEAGKKNRFHANQTPWNKGKKGWQPEGNQATQFKKGTKPLNTRKQYATRICPKDGYILIKLSDKNWVHKHRLVYERLHGPIPPKHVVGFRDKNRQNLAATNLELLTLAENAKRNSMWHNYPRELAELMVLNGRIKSQATKQQKANT